MQISANVIAEALNDTKAVEEKRKAMQESGWI